MALYRVQGNGKAPAGLQAGDEVVTGGGTYRILGVNADGSYRSSLSNKYQTIYNYRGSYGTPSAGQTDAAQVRTPGYTPSGAASEAKAVLDRVLAEKPGSYTSRWDSELDALYDQIANRKAFSYDLGSDPLYRQYREQYQSAGRLAMENTMGAAASLTGGYGSSYSQQAGQQAYNGYLQELAALVPELRQAALAEYQQEGKALQNQYSMLDAQEKADYDRWQEARGDWQKQLEAAQAAYEDAGSQDQKLYQTLLAHFSDKAEQERKLSASGVRLTDSGDTGSRGESLSSTAAESLQRAVGNYLKRGNGDLAQALAAQYTARMTPAQRQRFEKLLGQYGMTLA